MKLYVLTTIGLGDFHIIAKSPNEAEAKLMELFNRADYGLYRDRIIKSFEVIMEEISNFPKDIPDFSSGHRLILPNSCKSKDALNDIDPKHAKKVERKMMRAVKINKIID